MIFRGPWSRKTIWNFLFRSQVGLYQPASQCPAKGEALSNQALSASFQAAVMDILMAKTKKALEKYPVKTLVVAGGVAANQGPERTLGC